jgi:hypothetical protein
MRRGETAKFVQQLRGLPDLYTAFDGFAAALMHKCAALPCRVSRQMHPSIRHRPLPAILPGQQHAAMQRAMHAALPPCCRQQWPHQCSA